MKSTIATAVALGTTAALANVQGFDISHYQPTVDFGATYSDGARFVIIKATEGTTTVDATFSSHYSGASSAGFIRGAYHFAHPGDGTGAAQAGFFISKGGGWTADGKTLPGMVDLESEKGHPTCWGLTPTAMVAWIKDFSDTYHGSTGRYPMLYTNPSWWTSCTGNSNAFASTNALVLAHYASAIGPIPGGWSSTGNFWQNTDKYAHGGDGDVFLGTAAQLQAFANPSNATRRAHTRSTHRSPRVLPRVIPQELSP